MVTRESNSGELTISMTVCNISILLILGIEFPIDIVVGVVIVVVKDDELKVERGRDEFVSPTKVM